MMQIPKATCYLFLGKRGRSTKVYRTVNEVVGDYGFVTYQNKQYRVKRRIVVDEEDSELQEEQWVQVLES